MDYALHETLELSEIVAFKTLSLTKAKTMKALVSDQKLKDIMQMDIGVTTRQLEDYQALFEKMGHQSYPPFF